MRQLKGSLQTIVESFPCYFDSRCLQRHSLIALHARNHRTLSSSVINVEAHTSTQESETFLLLRYNKDFSLGKRFSFILLIVVVFIFQHRSTALRLLRK